MTEQMIHHVSSSHLDVVLCVQTVDETWQTVEESIGSSSLQGMINKVSSRCYTVIYKAALIIRHHFRREHSAHLSLRRGFGISLDLVVWLIYKVNQSLSLDLFEDELRICVLNWPSVTQSSFWLVQWHHRSHWPVGGPECSWHPMRSLRTCREKNLITHLKTETRMVAVLQRHWPELVHPHFVLQAVETYDRNYEFMLQVVSS